MVAELAQSSNYTMVLEVSLGDDYAWAVYKPAMGEAPLADFPPGLYKRERAAYVLSNHLGWKLVPPTVIREDGPFGTGSLQLFIEHDPREHYFRLYDTREDLYEQLRKMAVFDLLTNNTDRKGGHVLLDAQQHVWGIDHGLTFHPAPKLRTVIWDFAGDDIAQSWCDDVEPLMDEVPAELHQLLHPVEIDALQRRASRIVRLPFLPRPQSDFAYPWPPI